MTASTPVPNSPGGGQAPLSPSLPAEVHRWPGCLTPGRLVRCGKAFSAALRFFWMEELHRRWLNPMSCGEREGNFRTVNPHTLHRL